MGPDLPGVFGFVEKATCVGHVYSDGFRVALFISLCYDEDVFQATAFPFPVSSYGYREGVFVCMRARAVFIMVGHTSPFGRCPDNAKMEM